MAFEYRVLRIANLVVTMYSHMGGWWEESSNGCTYYKYGRDDVKYGQLQNTKNTASEIRS